MFSASFGISRCCTPNVGHRECPQLFREPESSRLCYPLPNYRSTDETRRCLFRLLGPQLTSPSGEASISSLQRRASTNKYEPEVFCFPDVHCSIRYPVRESIYSGLATRL